MSKWHDVSEAPRLARELTTFDPENPRRNYTDDLLLETKHGDKPPHCCTGWAALRRPDEVAMWFETGLRCGSAIPEDYTVTRWAYLNDVLEVLDNG